MRKSLLIIMIFLMSITSTYGFNDVEKSNWYKEPLDYLVKRDLVEGFSDNTFRPNTYLKRKELVKMLVKSIYGKLNEEDNKYLSYYEKGIKEKILTDDFFKLNKDKYITRMEVALIVSNIKKLNFNINKKSKPFEDLNFISSKNKEAILRAYKSNILVGYSDNKFRPRNHFKRSEGLSVIFKIDKKIGIKLKNRLKAFNHYIPNFHERYLKYNDKNKFLSLDKVITYVNIGLDYNFYENISISKEPRGIGVLCNKYVALPKDYRPENLIEIPSKYHINDNKEYYIRSLVFKEYKRMYNDALKKSIHLKIASSYRSFEYQKNLYNRYKETHGQKNADRFSARPRHSEHETGLAIDFSPVADSFENTEKFKWLKDNSYKYGFIIRYPKNKTFITGYKYEPWHFRYVGKYIAKKINKKNITYDEYYNKYIISKDQ